MPKKNKQESQLEQSLRFQRDVQKMIDAGELNPTEADKKLSNLVAKAESSKRD